MAARIQVEILVAPGCTSRRQTERQVMDLLNRASLKADVDTIVVENAAQADELRFLGSPSVRINGIDVEPEAREREEYGLG